MGDQRTQRDDPGGLVAAPSRSSQDWLTAEFHQPPAQFEGCFTSFYRLTLELPDDHAGLSDLLQPEWANIRFFCGSTPRAAIGNIAVEGARFIATGPSSLPCRFTLGPARMWGVGLLPVGWARLMHEDASALANVVCDGTQHRAFSRFAGLAETLCNPDLDPQEQLAVLVAALEQMQRPCRDEAKVRQIHIALVDGDHASVHDLADACAMSIRTLERVCARYFGFSPKLLMRRQRFMRSLTTYMLHQGSRWTEAMDADYHDQAQFTREFHTFMTMNPSEYAALDHPILASFMEARARLRGSAAQTLDAPRHPV